MQGYLEGMHNHGWKFYSCIDAHPIMTQVPLNTASHTVNTRVPDFMPGLICTAGRAVQGCIWTNQS